MSKACVVVVGLAMVMPLALEAQRVLAEWEVPPGRDVVGAAGLDRGDVVLWLDDGIVQTLDANLQPIHSTRLEGIVLAVDDAPGQGIQAFLSDSATRIITDTRRPQVATTLPVPSGRTVTGAAAVGDTWFLLLRPSRAEENVSGSVVAWSAASGMRQIVDSVPEGALLRALDGLLAVAEAKGRMAITLYDTDGRTIKTATPRSEVMDSLTTGSLGLPGAQWRSGPVLPFCNGGLLQPIRDLTSDRTIMMTYDSAGTPNGWGVVLGASFEAVTFLPDAGILVAVVQAGNRTTVQKLRWPC